MLADTAREIRVEQCRSRCGQFRNVVRQPAHPKVPIGILPGKLDAGDRQRQATAGLFEDVHAGDCGFVAVGVVLHFAAEPAGDPRACFHRECEVPAAESYCKGRDVGSHPDPPIAAGTARFQHFVPMVALVNHACEPVLYGLDREERA